MQTYEAKITGLEPDGFGALVTLTVHVDDLQTFIHRETQTATVEFCDGRTVSPEQRRKAHALINEIAEWAGDLPEYIKQATKMDFIASHAESIGAKLFSLSDCSVTVAREYISFLIDFIVEHGIPTHQNPAELCENINRYVYACLMNKRCAVCGRKADLHHVDRVGMGRNRDDIFQLGMKVLPLCREHHEEAHRIGDDNLCEAFHLQPVELTKEVAKVYRLTRKNIGG